jgi:tricorn protease
MIYDGSPAVLMSFNADRSRLAYFEQETLGVAETKAGQKPGTGKIDTVALEVRVDPRAEWRQMFWEAWRFERNNYYRADMGGLDWQAVGKRYEKYLPYVAHRRDLDYVFGLMLGELSTSHAYVYPEPAEPGVADRAAKAALLGADYERGGPGDRYVRFARVYRGSLTLEGARGPLGEPGINVEPGDYLLEIDGQPLDAAMNPGALLINKAGRVVTLTVNGKPSFDGARRVQVRPIPNENDLRYYEWVEENRRKVDKLSGGRIGYVHYPNTSEGGQKEFIRGYYAQTDKDAFILDERWNSGGNPQPMVLPTLARRRQTVSVYRRWGVGGEILAINGPKAMLINDYAGSGGDLTPWMWRDSGMGALIGTRTFGGLVGISAMTDLMDGGRVSAPSHARFDPRTGQQIAENVGIEPDIEVDLRPDLLAKGQDPQLEAAVKYLLEQLEKNPVKDATPKFELPRP